MNLNINLLFRHFINVLLSVEAFGLRLSDMPTEFKHYTPLAYRNTLRPFNGLGMSFYSNGNSYQFSLVHHCSKCGEFEEDIFVGTCSRLNSTRFEECVARAHGHLEFVYFIGRINLEFVNGGGTDSLYFIKLPEELSEFGPYSSLYHSLVYDNSLLTAERNSHKGRTEAETIPPQQSTSDSESSSALPKFVAKMDIHVILDTDLQNRWKESGVSMDEEIGTHIDILKAAFDVKFSDYSVVLKLARSVEILDICNKVCRRTAFFDAARASSQLLAKLEPLAKAPERKATFVLVLTTLRFGRILGEVSRVGESAECGKGTNVGYISFSDFNKADGLLPMSITAGSLTHEIGHLLDCEHDDDGQNLNVKQCNEKPFVMHSNAQPTTKTVDTMFEFSPCSIAAIGKQLARYRRQKKFRPALCIDFDVLPPVDTPKQKRSAAELVVIDPLAELSTHRKDVHQISPLMRQRAHRGKVHLGSRASAKFWSRLGYSPNSAARRRSTPSVPTHNSGTANFIQQIFFHPIANAEFSSAAPAAGTGIISNVQQNIVPLTPTPTQMPHAPIIPPAAADKYNFSPSTNVQLQLNEQQRQGVQEVKTEERADGKY